MEFLDNNKLRKTFQAIASSKEGLKIAIAYWGRDALDLLKLDPGRRDIMVLCCLKGGKSDPKVIKLFGKRARQDDRLHAKVIWSPAAAIVGSANASSNGLPEEEGVAGSLIEAGVYLQNNENLEAIEKWFDKLYEKAKPITKADLDEAQRARNSRFWGDRGPKRSLLEALSNNPAEFVQQRIYFYLYEEFCSPEENRSVKNDLNANFNEISAALKIGPADRQKCDWYTFSAKAPKEFFPENAILIEGRYRNKRIRLDEFYIRKSFDVVDIRPIDVLGNREWSILVLHERYIRGFNYKLTKKDRIAISAAATELWDKGKRGVENDRLLALKDAAPILAKHWR